MRIVKFLMLFAFPFLCFVSSEGHAAGDPNLTVNDILKKTESHYLRMQGMVATFRQSVTSSATGGMISEASGKLYYEKPKQMRWEYEKPEPQIFVANRQLAWLHVPSEKQVSLLDAGRIFSHPLAQTFFEGTSELKKYYEVALDAKQSTKEIAVLKLVPRQEDPEIKLLFIAIELSRYRLSSIEIQNVLGNLNRIVLESQNAVADLDPQLFQLDLPPSTGVVDQDGRSLNPGEIEILKQRLTSKTEKQQ
jgi:outer membrane lipoprotein carrier protein